MNTKLRKLAIPGVLAAGLGAGVTLADVMKDPVPNATAQQLRTASAPLVSPDPSAAGLSSAFRAASSAARGAVVQVRVETAARAVRGTPFDEMFGGRVQMPPQQGSGSGFILSADGYVLTNNHVVDDASRVKVVLNDKREFDARVVGRDPNTDIAVLKIEGRGLPIARVGDSDQLEMGDWVLALGYPLQLGQTTTAGIVSAKGRDIGIMERNGATNPLEHYIQTDAAINPGNSGGPLIDLQGRVVGVNSAIASPTGYYSGYGFAVPINLAKRVADDLIRYGVVHRPMLGVEIRDAAPADAEVFGLRAPEGAVISSEPKAGARDAGLRLGDVIVSVDGGTVRNTGDLMEQVMRKQPGDEVVLEVIRYGRRQRRRGGPPGLRGRPSDADDRAAAPPPLRRGRGGDGCGPLRPERFAADAGLPHRALQRPRDPHHRRASLRHGGRPPRRRGLPRRPPPGRDADHRELQGAQLNV